MSKIPAQALEVSILFTDDVEIRALNRRFRGKNSPTDVLSFSQTDVESRLPSPVLGDIVISLDTARRQACEKGISLHSEVVELLVHGLLHLAGYDHEGVSEQKAQRMMMTQLRIVAELLPQ